MGGLVNKRHGGILLVGLAVLVGVAALIAFMVQSILSPGSPRPDADLADAQIRSSVIEPSGIESFAGSVRSQNGEWSLRLAPNESIVEWRDGQPHAVDFEADGVLSLGVSESGELLVADLVKGNVEVSTLSGPVAVVRGGETPILEVTAIDEHVLFGWTNEGFGAFPIGDELGASHLLDAADALEAHALGDEYFIVAVNGAGTNSLTRWSLDAGFVTLLELPDVEGIRDPSIGVHEDGTVYVGIDDSVWRSQVPYEEIELATQARLDRGGRWLGWVDVAPDASAWIYHEVDSGYLLTGGPGEEWRQAAYFGIPIGEEWRLGDGDSDVTVAYADDEQIVIDSYEGRIWVSLATQ